MTFINTSYIVFNGSTEMRRARWVKLLSFNTQIWVTPERAPCSARARSKFLTCNDSARRAILKTFSKLFTISVLRKIHKTAYSKSNNSTQIPASTLYTVSNIGMIPDCSFTSRRTWEPTSESTDSKLLTCHVLPSKSMLKTFSIRFAISVLHNTHQKWHS